MADIARASDPYAEIVTVSPEPAYCGRWAQGDPIHALLRAVLEQRDLIALTWKDGGEARVSWTERGPRIVLHANVVRHFPPPRGATGPEPTV